MPDVYLRRILRVVSEMEEKERSRRLDFLVSQIHENKLKIRALRAEIYIKKRKMTPHEYMVINRWLEEVELWALEGNRLVTDPEVARMMSEALEEIKISRDKMGVGKPEKLV